MTNLKVVTLIGYLLFFFVASFQSCDSAHKKEVFLKPDSPATVKGENELGWLISHYMIYPKSESNVNRAGVIDLTWIIDEKGNVIEVNANLNDDNQEADTAIGRKLIKEQKVMQINQPIIDNLIYAVKLLKFHPAQKDGKPIRSKKTFSIEFILY